MPTLTDWITTGISVLCMIGSFISFVIARREKKAAKDSEEKTRTYAENADLANRATEKLYNALLEELNRKKPLEEKEELKARAKAFVCMNYFVNTSAVATHLGIDKSEAFALLKEMAMSDNMIHFAGDCTEENIDEIIWQQ